MDFLAETLRGQRHLPGPLPLPDGSRVEYVAEGVVRITPGSPDAKTPWRLISAGVHGNETAPVELLDFIIRDVLAGRLVVRSHVMLQLANPAALRSGVRYLDYDMNRLFGGAHRRHADTQEALRAAELETLAAEFFAPANTDRLHLDLHTAIRGSVFERFAISPWQDGNRPAAEQLSWLAGAGIEAVLLHSAPSPTYSYYTRQQCGATAFTLELGKARPFGHNDLTRFQGIDKALRRLLEGETPGGDAPPPPLFKARYDIIKHSDAFRLHLAESVDNFTPLADGQLIAEDGEHRYVASGGNERILFPNPNVQAGLRAGIVIHPADH